MLVAENYPALRTHVALPKQELLKVRRSKTSLTRARAYYDYATIRFPFAFLGLIGMSARLPDGAQWSACVPRGCLAAVKKQSR
jgi:hypothetical protein